MKAATRAFPVTQLARDIYAAWKLDGAAQGFAGYSRTWRFAGFDEARLAGGYLSLSLADEVRQRALVVHPNREKDDAVRRQEEADRRKGRRVPISFAIEVSGFDAAGHMFREVTVTTDISEHGCRFDLLRELHRGDVIAIQRVLRGGNRQEDSKPLLFEAVWAYASNHGWTIGASKLQSENIWQVAFPPKKPVSESGQ